MNRMNGMNGIAWDGAGGAGTVLLFRMGGGVPVALVALLDIGGWLVGWLAVGGALHSWFIWALAEALCGSGSGSMVLVVSWWWRRRRRSRDGGNARRHVKKKKKKKNTSLFVPSLLVTSAAVSRCSPLLIAIKRPSVALAG
ncbi:hypothetical protein IWX48DRAFT_606321, partial [Phyllosticta citricarpa]